MLRSSLAIGLWTLGTPLMAAVTQCDLNVHKAYQRALQHGWSFTCENASFVPEPASRSMACQAGQAAGQGGAIQGHFFHHRLGRSPQMRAGWTISAVRIGGGRWKALEADPQVRVGFVSTGQAAPGQRLRLSGLQLAKPGGDCSRVYEEAF